jgi:hypothetical protein
MLHPQKYELTDSEKQEKTTIIQRRIIKEVTQYHNQHQKGLPMQMLSAKYSRSIQNMGIGFPEFVDAMRQKKLIVVQFLDHGAREVYPSNVKVENVPQKEKDWF